MAAARLGHLIVRFGDEFYFIPQDKIGPPIAVGKAGAAEIKELMEKLKKRNPENFGEALRVSDKDLIRFCARN